MPKALVDPPDYIPSRRSPRERLVIKRNRLMETDDALTGRINEFEQRRGAVRERIAQLTRDLET